VALDGVALAALAGGGTVEQLSLRRSYGRWGPYGEGRALISLGGDSPFTYTALRGSMSEPFPSGDTIVANYPRA
jgi:hypothetical protein